jgi:3-oxoadipyl-CoA thiolase
MTELRDVFICDAVRTPIGRYGGALAKVRTDDLAAVPIKALMQRHANVDWSALDEVVFGCANQAGETTATSRAWRCCSPASPTPVPGLTVTGLRLRAHAVGDAARAICRGETDFAIAGGVESMTRAPSAGKGADIPAQRRNPRHHAWLALHQPIDEIAYGVDPWPRPRERGREYQVARADQDAFALRRAARRQGNCVRLFRRGDRCGRAPGGKAGPVKVKASTPTRHHARRPLLRRWRNPEP